MRIAALLMLLLLLLLLPATAAHATESAPRRPNILWLTVEDMSPWLACYGDRTAPTPNLDRLAREGVRYTNAFATSPVCAPARHTLITGLYATTTGAMHMRNGAPSQQALERDPQAYDDIPSYEAVPPPEVRCFPELLRIAGYYATNNAKQDYQFRAPPTVWDESSNRAHWRSRKSDQPFFAVFNCNWTHESQAFPEAKERASVVKAANVPIPPYYPDTYLVRQALAQTYNNIVAMDSWVGQKIAELEEDGLLDSTIIIFFSDHGVGLPRGKRSSYDSGLRVPLIVRFPDGYRAGESDSRLVSFIDFAPTMLSLAGIRPPAFLPGRPFLGEFKTDPPQYVFSTQDRMDATMDMVRSVSDGRFRYVRNLMPDVPHLPSIAYRDRLAMMKEIEALRDGREKPTPDQWQIVSRSKPPEEFYDTQSDPHEVRNLIHRDEHADRIQAMRDALERWTNETDDLGLIQPESRMVREELWPPDGIQPRTSTPIPTIAAGGILTISCDTTGASIGYRKKGETAWTVYTNPTAIDPSASYEVVAHRIGFKRSPTVEITPSR